MFSIRTSSTSWPGKQRISILEKDEIDKAEDLNKNVSGWEEKKRYSREFTENLTFNIPWSITVR